MRKILAMLCVLTAMAGFASEASAAIITFESLAHDDSATMDHGAVYEEQGFRISNTATEEDTGFPPSLASFGTGADGYAGSTALFNDNYLGTTVLSMVGGGRFTLKTIDLAELDPSDAFSVVFTGLLAGGATATQTFTLDGVYGFESFTFGSAFTDLVSVGWDQTPYFHQFDNLSAVLDAGAVPEPGSMLLLGSGLIGLLTFGRKAGRRFLQSNSDCQESGRESGPMTK